MSWEKSDSGLTVRKRLKKRNRPKDNWKNKATQYLRYNNAKTVCRFALLSPHDTISDLTNPGLMKIGTSVRLIYLEPTQWVSEGFKTIEHVAPQKRNGH